MVCLWFLFLSFFFLVVLAIPSCDKVTSNRHPLFDKICHKNLEHLLTDCTFFKSRTSEVVYGYRDYVDRSGNQNSLVKISDENVSFNLYDFDSPCVHYSMTPDCGTCSPDFIQFELGNIYLCLVLVRKVNAVMEVFPNFAIFLTDNNFRFTTRKGLDDLVLSLSNVDINHDNRTLSLRSSVFSYHRYFDRLLYYIITPDFVRVSCSSERGVYNTINTQGAFPSCLFSFEYKARHYCAASHSGYFCGSTVLSELGSELILTSSPKRDIKGKGGFNTYVDFSLFGIDPNFLNDLMNLRVLASDVLRAFGSDMNANLADTVSQLEYAVWEISDALLEVNLTCPSLVCSNCSVCPSLTCPPPVDLSKAIVCPPTVRLDVTKVCPRPVNLDITKVCPSFNVTFPDCPIPLPCPNITLRNRCPDISLQPVLENCTCPIIDFPPNISVVPDAESVLNILNMFTHHFLSFVISGREDHFTNYNYYEHLNDFISTSRTSRSIISWFSRVIFSAMRPFIEVLVGAVTEFLNALVDFVVEFEPVVEKLVTTLEDKSEIILRFFLRLLLVVLKSLLKMLMMMEEEINFVELVVFFSVCYYFCNLYFSLLLTVLFFLFFGLTRFYTSPFVKYFYMFEEVHSLLLDVATLNYSFWNDSGTAYVSVGSRILNFSFVNLTSLLDLNITDFVNANHSVLEGDSIRFIKLSDYYSVNDTFFKNRFV